MPQKPIAYTAKYEYADENDVSVRERQLMDSIHYQHIRDMQPPIKKETHLSYIKSKSPNKKKQQLEEDRQLVITTENQNLVDRLQRIQVRQDEWAHTSHGPKPTNLGQRLKEKAKIQAENRNIKSHLNRVKGTYSVAQWERDAEASQRLAQQISKAPKRSKTRTQQRPKHIQNDEAAEFEFVVLEKNDSSLPMRTVKEIKMQIQSRLPMIHSKASTYLAQEIQKQKRMDPFELPRRPFE